MTRDGVADLRPVAAVRLLFASSASRGLVFGQLADSFWVRRPALVGAAKAAKQVPRQVAQLLMGSIVPASSLAQLPKKGRCQVFYAAHAKLETVYETAG